MAQSMTGYCPVNGLFDLSIITPQVNRGIVDNRYAAKGYGKKSGRKCVCCGFDLERYPIYSDGRCFQCMESEGEEDDVNVERARALAIYFKKKMGLKTAAVRMSITSLELRNAAKGKPDKKTARALFRLSREWSVGDVTSKD